MCVCVCVKSVALWGVGGIPPTYFQNLFGTNPSNIILLIDEGMGDYHFYSDETSDIRRGRRPS